jgi:hypothetical protein
MLLCAGIFIIIGCHDAAVGGAAAWCCVHGRGTEDNGRLILTGEEKVVAERGAGGGATTQAKPSYFVTFDRLSRKLHIYTP